MRAASLAIVAIVSSLAGCGYRGPVLPPSPQIPDTIRDLAVTERSDQLVITFDTPARTTDNLPIKRFSEIELRIGAAAYQLPLPPPNNPDDPHPHHITKTVPASEWIHQHIAVDVRTSVKQHDHYSQWSNRVALDVIPPLAAPELQAKATKAGFLLTWKSEEGLHYQIFRQGPNDKAPVQIATADASPYVDTTSQWDTSYGYSIVAQKEAAESLPSKSVRAESADVFPPAVPASITALAAPDSIEVSWSRSPDADLKGYYVYRSVDGGKLEWLHDLLALPSFSDHNVQHGHTYQYAVSAIDQKGNESEKSKPVEVKF